MRWYCPCDLYPHLRASGNWHERITAPENVALVTQSTTGGIVERPTTDQAPLASTRRARAPGTSQPVLVLFNPAARMALAGEIVAATIRDTLGEHGVACAIVETTSEVDVSTRAAAAAATSEFSAVVAAGGDGTVHAVARGLLRGLAPDKDPVVLGILPLGTMNNIAHSLGIPEPLDAACEVLAHARPRLMDVGSADGHLFIEVAGMGVEARLVAHSESIKGRLLRSPSTLLEMVGILRRFRPARVVLDLDGQRLTLRALQVTVCNTPRYGLSFAAAPDARMDDGWLDVVVYEGYRVWALARRYWRMLGGGRDSTPGVRHLWAREVRVAPHGATWPVHTDGTRSGTTPVTVRVLPGALQVIAPPAPDDGRHGGLTPPEVWLRAAVPPATTVAAQAALAAATHTGETLAASAENLLQSLEARTDEARAAVGVVPSRRGARRARVLRLAYLGGLAGSLALTYAVHRANVLPGDLRLTRAMQRHRTVARDRFWRAVAAPGFPELSTPLVALTAAGFWGLRLRLEALFMVLASGTNAANWLIKRLVRRERPDIHMVHVAKVINEPGFPSGHVMHYLSFYGFLAAAALANLRPSRLRRTVVATCLAMVGLVGPSRVYLGAHWPSDVAAGYLYGGLYLGGLLELYARAKQRQAAKLHPGPGVGDVR